MLTHKQQYIQQARVFKGAKWGELRRETMSVSDESETTNMLLPTFHAQFSRETTKPKTQPGRLAASWHIWYSFLSSRLQKDCVFSLSFIFFPLYFSLFRENGTIFQMLNYIVVVQFGMEVVLSTQQHRVWYKKE